MFAGGWTLEAAQQVAADEAAGEGTGRGIDVWAVLEHLGTLVEKSIVVAEGDDRPRYRLLETARAYALEQLAQAGDTDALAQRHAQTMSSLLEQAYEARFGEGGALDEAGYIALVRPEIDNLRAALAWAMASDPPLAVALAAVATPALAMSGLVAEAIAVLHGALPIAGERADEASATRLWYQAVMWGGDGSLPDDVLLQAIKLAEPSSRRQRWPRALHFVLVRKAWRHVRLHEFDAGQRAREEAAGIESRRWPGWLRAEHLNLEAHWNWQLGKSWDDAEVFERMAALLPASGEETRHFRMRLIEAAEPDPARRAQWHREGEALDEDGIKALCLGETVGSDSQVGHRSMQVDADL